MLIIMGAWGRRGADQGEVARRESWDSWYLEEYLQRQPIHLGLVSLSFLLIFLG